MVCVSIASATNRNHRPPILRVALLPIAYGTLFVLLLQLQLSHSPLLRCVIPVVGPYAISLDLVPLFRRHDLAPD